MAAIEELAADVDRAEIIASVEQAAGLAASRSTGRNLRVRLDTEKGNLLCYITKRVTQEVLDPEIEVAEDAAPDGFSPGDLVEISVPFGTAARSAARAARAVLEARLGAARMLSRAERYRDRIGKLETAIVARREGHDLIVNLGPVEGRLPADEQSRHEVFNPEDTIRVAVQSIEPYDPPVILSRIAPAVLAGLIERETPEVRRGLVQVRAVARHPGIRAKVAVSSSVPGVDAVAACLGPGGARIRAVSRELRGERVDVILWDEKVETFARNALRPAEVLAVRPAEEGEVQNASPKLRQQGGLLVTVSEAELPRALGKRGQNVRLAAELLGVPIEVEADGSSTGERSRRPQPGRGRGRPQRTDDRGPRRGPGGPADPRGRRSPRDRGDSENWSRNEDAGGRRSGPPRPADRRGPPRESGPRRPGDRGGPARESGPRRPGDRGGPPRESGPRRPSDRGGPARESGPRRPGDRGGPARESGPRRPGDRGGPARESGPRRPGDRGGPARESGPRRPGDRGGPARESGPRRPGDRRGPARESSPRRPADPQGPARESLPEARER